MNLKYIIVNQENHQLSTKVKTSQLMYLSFIDNMYQFIVFSYTIVLNHLEKYRTLKISNNMIPRNGGNPIKLIWKNPRITGSFVQGIW